MRYSPAIVLLTCGVAAAEDPSFPLAPADPGRADREGAVWRVSQNCGVNCLYVMLKAHGRAAEYDRLMADLQARGEGKQNNLSDLRAVAEGHGLSCRVGKATLDGLAASPKPVLAHLEKATVNRGHFVVVVSVGPESVEVVDGTSGALSTWPVREFSQKWSGYVLYASPPWYETVPAWAFAVAAAAAGAGLGWGAERLVRKPRAAAPPAPATADPPVPA